VLELGHPTPTSSSLRGCAGRARDAPCPSSRAPHPRTWWLL